MESLAKRAARLRNYELYCYSICYHLLEKEHTAIKASKQTLLHLLHDESFFLTNGSEQRTYVKKLSMKYALQAYDATL